MVVIENNQRDIVVDINGIRLVCAQHLIHTAAHKPVDNAVVFADFAVDSKNTKAGQRELLF